MKDRDKKFNVGEGDDIEKNIKKLQRELDEMLMKGAPEIKKEDADKEVKRAKLEEKKIEEKKVVAVPENKHIPTYNKPAKYSEQGSGLLKNRKIYIVIFGFIAFALTLIKAPVFRYTTPARQDNDIPGIDVGFRYYNNILGRQIKSETIVYIGNEKVVIHISMQTWFNLGKEKKLAAIDYYRKK
ncbi:MAG: hypothetical protein NC905_02850 [Candidatus Omnitrophica bacterium]|nr:hypothetical protein [Candidatus Omnitrophota bacterium]MCM8777187.1 hypothetical protein [Candidatus Omnitrophota bacterium]